jgi:hypothetical protein
MANNETPSQLIDYARYCLLLRPFFLWVRSDKLQRLGSGDLQRHFCIGPEPSTTELTPSPSESRDSETGFKSMSSSGLSLPSHGDTPLLRGDVTRLVSLGDPSPLEDQGPFKLSGIDLLAEDTLDARLSLRIVEALREVVRQLR